MSSSASPTRVSDLLLDESCSGLADNTAFGGCASGVDWRRWDGAATGCQSILCDQCGILAVALDRCVVSEKLSEE